MGFHTFQVCKYIAHIIERNKQRFAERSKGFPTVLEGERDNRFKQSLPCGEYRRYNEYWKFLRTIGFIHGLCAFPRWTNEKHDRSIRTIRYYYLDKTTYVDFLYYPLRFSFLCLTYILHDLLTLHFIWYWLHHTHRRNEWSTRRSPQ